MKTLLITLISFGTLFSACNKNENKIPVEVPIVNLLHFNHLYDEIEIEGKSLGVVKIYSEYPNYDYAIEPNEGFTCVDDVARGIVLLVKLYEKNGDVEVYNKLEHLIEFVLYMQNDNGYFNNFLWGNLSINKTYQTSVAEPNWWSWRALWALESSLLVIEDNGLKSKIQDAISILIINIKRDISIPDSFQTEIVETLEMPTWLPGKHAADQAAVLILGLVPNYTRTNDNDIKQLIDALSLGVIQMQKGDQSHFPYGAFLSWQNIWHAWGNSQSYALLVAGETIDNSMYIEKALLEIDNYYDHLLKNGLFAAMWIEKNGDIFLESKKEVFPQIAYGIRPMVFASEKAYQMTSNEKYKAMAYDFEQWLYGENIANEEMYDENTGRGYDGINSANSINLNAGAESTIEALLIRATNL
jgi:hypothetical protein